MSKESSWRIVKIPDDGLPLIKARDAQAALEELAAGRYLVSDTRLQAIAEAWERWQYLNAHTLHCDAIHEAWLTLRYLLDALIEEGS